MTIGIFIFHPINDIYNCGVIRKQKKSEEWKIYKEILFDKNFKEKKKIYFVLLL